MPAGGTCIPTHWPQTERKFPSPCSSQSQELELVHLLWLVSICLMKGLACPGAKPFGGCTLGGLINCYGKLLPPPHSSCNSSVSPLQAQGCIPAAHQAWVAIGLMASQCCRLRCSCFLPVLHQLPKWLHHAPHDCFGIWKHGGGWQECCAVGPLKWQQCFGPQSHSYKSLLSNPQRKRDPALPSSASGWQKKSHPGHS